MYTVLSLVICLWFIMIWDIYCAKASSKIHINDNITKEEYSNDIILNCSFTIGEGEEFAAMTLSLHNSTAGIMQALAGFSSKASPKLTSFGMYLFGNETTLTSIKDPHYTFVLTFDNLTCRHEHRYICKLTVLVPSAGYASRVIESDLMSIAVTVLPSKPEITTTENDIPSRKRIKRSTNLTTTNDTHTFEIIEGDNITFKCKGDVGRPKGKFMWQKIYSSESKFNYTNISTETIPESCSYEGNSTLTIQVTDADNQARIRCIVKSELLNGTKHVDSEPLLINFKVRRPFIELFPNKTIFQEGDSVELNCKANGNPNPSYSWTKDNMSKVIIADNDTLLINKANISDSGLYTCDTRNSIQGTDYIESVSTYIKIENVSTTPSSATIYPPGTDKTQVERFAYIFGGIVASLLVLVCIGMCIYWNRTTLFFKSCTQNLEINMPKGKHRQINETDSEGSQKQEDMYADSPDGVYDKSGQPRYKEENICQHYDTATGISNESNKHITSKNHNLLDCNTRPEGKSKPDGYESVVLDIPILSRESKGFDRDETEITRQHTTQNVNIQKSEEDTTNSSPISLQPVEYAQVNEATKLRNINKNNEINKQTVTTSTETKERIEVESEERQIKKDEKVVNKRQQTSGGPGTSTRNDKTSTYTNKAFEIEENRQANEFSSQLRFFDEPRAQGYGERTQNAP